MVTKIENKAGHRVVKAIFPLRSRKQCLGCHEGKVGDVLGAATSAISLADADRAIKRRHALIGLLSAGALGLTTGSLFLLLRNVVIKPISKLTKVTRTISEEWDLTQRIEYSAKDEIGELAAAFRQMQANLGALAKTIKEASLRVSELSGEIVDASRQQVEGASEQASAVEEVTATVEELSTAAGQIADNSGEVVVAAEKTLKSLESGQAAVEETTRSMEALRGGALSSSRKVMELGEKSQQIGAVVELINEVVAETKILSLNASIEASKAGEAGRGFAVVAGEIRKLAEKTASSTEVIRGIVEEIQSSVNDTVMSSEESVRRVEVQVGLVKRVEAALAEILPQAEATVKLAKQIAAATQQQKAGSEQVVTSVKEILNISKQTQTTSTSATTSAEKLQSLAEQLKEAVAEFRLDHVY